MNCMWMDGGDVEKEAWPGVARGGGTGRVGSMRPSPGSPAGLHGDCGPFPGAGRCPSSSKLGPEKAVHA